MLQSGSCSGLRWNAREIGDFQGSFPNNEKNPEMSRMALPDFTVRLTEFGVTTKQFLKVGCSLLFLIFVFMIFTTMRVQELVVKLPELAYFFFLIVTEKRDRLCPPLARLNFVAFSNPIIKV